MRPKKYPFVFVLIRLTSLVNMDKIQKKCSFRTRLVGMISTKTKEYFVGRHLCIRSISVILWDDDFDLNSVYFGNAYLISVLGGIKGGAY